MVRVLHIMAGADAGGISTVVLNYYQHIDRAKIHFDVALTTQSVGQNADRLKALGARIFFLPLKSQGLDAFQKALYTLLKQERFDAVHVHENETSYIALKIAKECGVQCRVAHSHTTAPYASIKGEIRRISGCILNYHYATTVIGCGQMAGDRVFGKRNMKRPKAMVLPNAIDTDMFAFSKEIREEVRSELSVDNKFVLGMVGRLAYQKNQGFALEVLKQLHQKKPDAVLLIAGNGEDELQLRNYIRMNNMECYVQLLGRREDVQKLYQAFDVFLLPSKYEGFPVSAVEALASGLPTFLSDKITNELSFTDAVRYLPINNPSVWVDALAQLTYEENRELWQEIIKRHNLDINQTASCLENIYLGKG